MPDIDGFELVRRVRSMRDDLPILLISGDPSVGTDDAHTSSMGCTLLRKPVTRQELLAAVTGLLSVRGAVREPSMLSWRGSPL
jgi:DNA-binding response OmpR family regulator